MKRRQRGITLIECLISIVVFGLGIIAVAQCLLAAFRMSHLSAQVGLATLYTQAQMENVISLGVAPTSQDTKTITDAEFPQNTLTIEIYPDPSFVPPGNVAGANLVEITMDAHWIGPGNKRRDVILQSVMPNRIMPQ